MLKFWHQVNQFWSLFLSQGSCKIGRRSRCCGASGLYGAQATSKHAPSHQPVPTSKLLSLTDVIGWCFLENPRCILHQLVLIIVYHHWIQFISRFCLESKLRQWKNICWLDPTLGILSYHSLFLFSHWEDVIGPLWAESPSNGTLIYKSNLCRANGRGKF